LAAGLALLALPAFAQDMAPAAGSPAPMARETIAGVTDAGVETVLEAQQSAPAPVPPAVPAGGEFKNASKILKEAMKGKGWLDGWDEEKQRILVVGEADFNCADPASDPNFFALREMAAKRAILQAKAQIAEYVNSEISATEMLDIPGTDVHAVLGAENARITAAIEAKAAELTDLLAQTDEAQAAALRGATVGQRLDDLFAAAIKKLDEEYDKDAHKEEAKARLADLKAQYDQASREFQDLLARAEVLKREVAAKQSSTVKVQASLPLFGATVILQSESWNAANGKYQVALLVCWSKALEEASRAIATGRELQVNPGKMTIHQWLAKQDLATMIGPRQFIDETGNRWFLGITARPYDDEMNSIARMRYKGLAETFAQQMACFSVFGDIETLKAASQALETRGGDGDYAKDVDAVAESFAQTITQNLQNRTVRGLQKLAEEEVIHPVCGRGILVCVYGINASAATAALEIEKANIATLIEANRYQTFERGRNASNEAAVNASVNRAADFQAGMVDQLDRLQGEMDARHPEAAGGAQRNIYSVPEQPSRGAHGNAVSGSFLGDTDVSDDF